VGAALADYELSRRGAKLLWRPRVRMRTITSVVRVKFRS